MSGESKSVSRREFLKIAGVAGATIGLGAGLGGALAACGEEETTTTTAGATTTTAAESTSTTAAESTTTVSAEAEMGREIKIGNVVPITGVLANFGTAENWSMDLARKTVGDGVVLGDGKKHPITFIAQDTQSDSNRASQVAGDLVMNEKVDFLVASGTPDTVLPAGNQAEVLECPFVSCFNPWEAAIFGQNLTLDNEWKYWHGCYFGVDDEGITQPEAFKKIQSNGKMGVLLANDVDGNVWAQTLVPILEQNFDVVFPQQYQPGGEDFTVQIAEFKKAGCELITGTHYPPDFSNFFNQMQQQGLYPKLIYCGGKSFGNFAYPESIGPSAAGLMAGWLFHRAFPYVDSLTGMTCGELADDFEATTGGQWSQFVGCHAKTSWAVDALVRAKNPEDKDSIVEAIRSTKMDLILGPIDMTAPVDPKGRHITVNIYKQPLTCVQIVPGAEAKPVAQEKYQFDTNVVAEFEHVGVEVFDPIVMKYS